MTLRRLVGLCAAVSCTAVFALDVVTESEALIEHDDLTLARQVALRRAQASAIEQAGGLLQSRTVTTAVGVQERTSLSHRHRIVGTQIVSEHVEKNRLRLVAEVKVVDESQVAACQDKPLRKVLVTAFPVQYPEQITRGEYTGWAHDTALYLSKSFNGKGHLLGAHVAGQSPFADLEQIPDVERAGGLPVLVDWAKAARAQYVLTGVFRDFGTLSKFLFYSERQLGIEAMIYDGISGELLARRHFSRQLSGSTRLPASAILGSQAFGATTLGRSYLEIMAELSGWAENLIGCMPFSTRVLQVEGRRLYLDAGSDSGIEPGMELLLARKTGKGVMTPDGARLGPERTPVAGAVVKSVHPRYSVAEITARKNPPVARVGDVLFGL